MGELYAQRASVMFQQQFFPYWMPPTIFLPLPDDVDIINYSGTQGPQGEPGPIGPAGPQGEPGPPITDITYNTVLIDDDYIASKDDNYIGVQSDKPIDILLPTDPVDGTLYIIKLEMGPPIGNRKVTIITDNGITIDGSTSLVLQEPYEYTSLIYRGTEWHIV